MYNYTLNVNLDICLKIYTKVVQNIPKIDARISPDGISSDTSIINLFFTKPGSKIPIIKINITTTEVQLDKPTFNVSIIGRLDETENVDILFAEVEIDQIMKTAINQNDDLNVNLWTKELVPKISKALLEASKMIQQKQN